jgi:hypothetical protein
MKETTTMLKSTQKHLKKGEHTMERRIHEQVIRGRVRDLHLSESEIYVDNEARGRSGHMSHAMVDMGGGKFIVFNA